MHSAETEGVEAQTDLGNKRVLTEKRGIAILEPTETSTSEGVTKAAVPNIG